MNTYATKVVVPWLPGCGGHIAHALARCGFSDLLLAACQNMLEDNLRHFLVQWRQDLRIELATNSHGFLRNKQIALSTKIPNTFPSLRVLHLYVQPVTLWSDGFVPPVTENWTVKLPDLPRLAKYCKEEF
jgi:Holliday junction resolvase YEN1